MPTTSRPGIGSIALVTGATRGIGLEVARQLLAQGLTVWVGGRDPDKLRSALRQLDGDARALDLDVTDAASRAAAFQEVQSLDVLVNNAGVGGSPGTILDETADEFGVTYQTNVVAVAELIQGFVPHLRRSAHPRIVNVTSAGGSLTIASDPQASLAFRPAGSGLAYRASKAALNAVTVLAAQTLSPHGIKVNGVAPGLRKTALNAAAQAGGGDPAEGAASIVQWALLPDDGPTGVFANWDGATLPW